jgi:hypothetical protein
VEAGLLGVCFGSLRGGCFEDGTLAAGVGIGKWGAAMFKFKVVDGSGNADANGSINGSINGKNMGGPSNASGISSFGICFLDVLLFDGRNGRDFDNSSRIAFWTCVNCKFVPDVGAVEEPGPPSLCFLRQSRCGIADGLLRSFEGFISFLLIVKTECRDDGTDMVELENGVSESIGGSPVDGGGCRTLFNNTKLDGSDGSFVSVGFWITTGMAEDVCTIEFKPGMCIADNTFLCLIRANVGSSWNRPRRR